MGMRILVNGTSAMPGTAADVYLVEMLGALHRGRLAECTVALTRRQAGMARRLEPVAAVVGLDVPAGRIRRGLALQRLLPRAARETAADVLFTGGNFFVRRPEVAQVCLIENANVFSHPVIAWTAADRLRNALLRRLTQAAFAGADRLVFPSTDAAARFEEHGAPAARSAVVPHGWRAAGDPAAPRPLAEPYALCVTSVYPHKNLPRLVRAFAVLRQRHGYRGRLVLAGFGGRAAYRAAVQSAIASAGVSGDVDLRPAMPFDLLAAWYRHADLVVMPSLEETFGLPALEALGYGRPLAAAAARPGPGAAAFFNPFPDICGDAAEYFDPLSEPSMAAAMAAAIEPRRAAALASLGPARAARFTWDASAAALAAVFTAVRR